MLNLQFMINNDIEKDLMWEISVICDFNRRNMTLFNTTIDYCASTFKGRQHMILGYFLEEINHKGNIPLECPFKANVMYKVLNFTIDRKIVPNFSPTLKWTAMLTFYYKKQKVLTLWVFGRVDKLK